MLEKRAGIAVALPYCDKGRVEIWSTKRGALTEASLKATVETDPRFKLLRFQLLPGRRTVTVQPPADADPRYRRAVESAGRGRLSEALRRIRSALEAGWDRPSRLLSDPRMGALLVDPQARRKLSGLLRQHASESRITMVTEREPGDRLIIHGRVLCQQRPVSAVQLYLFHTDSSGRYAPEHPKPGHGANNPRLFGHLRSDAQGRFEVRTIRPASYPGLRNMRHVHFTAACKGYRMVDAQFYLSRDPAPSERRRRLAAERGWPILDERVDAAGVRHVSLLIEMTRADRGR